MIQTGDRQGGSSISHASWHDRFATCQVSCSKACVTMRPSRSIETFSALVFAERRRLLVTHGCRWTVGAEAGNRICQAAAAAAGVRRMAAGVACCRRRCCCQTGSDCRRTPLRCCCCDVAAVMAAAVAHMTGEQAPVPKQPQPLTTVHAACDYEQLQRRCI